MAKHPVPKKKTSKARTTRRYKAFQNRARVRLSEAIQLTECSKCQAAVRLHHACPKCGTYRDTNVLRQAEVTPEVKKEAPKKEATAETPEVKTEVKEVKPKKKAPKAKKEESPKKD